VKVGHSTGVTHTGRRRRHNEDSFVHEPPLFAIADGMGGPRAGEVASRLAAGALNIGSVGGTGTERVVALIHEANRRVYQRSSEDESVSGMGTTITVALVEDSVVTLGHVGDSRAYLARGGTLEQLTEDHSLVAELVRGGKLSPEEAEHHPQRAVITRALGTDPDVDVDTFTVAAEPGDIFLLCSDGLTTMIGDETILQVLEARRDDLDGAAQELIRLANKAGGEDNITVVAFEITDEDGPEPAAAIEETRPMPAVSDSVKDDEDTLDESDEIPAIDTMVVPPSEAARLRPSDKVSQGRKRRIWPVFLLLLLVAAAAAAIVVWVLTR
jgi:serine/threonine protein phosphatase PrpC